MPAHLDDEANAKKLRKFLKGGGTQTHIDGNCSVDALAKDGANCIQIDQTRHAMYRLRAWLTKTVQNYLVDVWRAEKERMFECNIIDPGQQLEVQSIIDIESAQCEYEEQADDPYDEDDSDIYGRCDIDGNDEAVRSKDEETLSPAVLQVNEALNSINQETVFDFGGGFPSSSSSVLSSDNKNGLLHFAYTINKEISTTFPTCKISDSKHTVTTPQIGSGELYNNNVAHKSHSSTHNGSINYFLHNRDFTNVMQELLASTFSFLPMAAANVTKANREIVSDFIGVSPSPSSSSPALNDNKNGLQTALVTSAGSAPIEANEVTGSNDIPTCSDSDNTISKYLDSAFPSYRIANTTDNTFVPCISIFKEYDKFPTFKTSYRNIKHENICYTSGRPDWEPYNWFFSQIRWSHDYSNSTYSFSELAIAAHILTGGATSPGQDLYTKTKCICLAFKRYFQKQKINELNYKSFFNPTNNVKTLAGLGSDNLLGIRRTPYFIDAPELFKDVRLNAWKAIQHWQASARIAKFGEGFQLKTKQEPVWIPDSVVWIYRTLDQRKQDKLALISSTESQLPSHQQHNNSSVNFVSSGVLPSASSAVLPATTNKNAHNLITRVVPETVCFYGHKVSSSKDYRGRQSWRVSPTPPWPAVPPDRPLCQKCFLFHRTAFLNGKSQYDFPQLYLYQERNINPVNSGGAASSTERPPG
jgi:hypothetical protein